MRIVHLTSVHRTLDSRIFYKECRTLVDAGYKTILITPHPHDETIDGVEVRSINAPSNRLQRILLTVWRLYFKALREHGDVYHFHDPELLPVGVALALGGKKVIYDVHEDVPKLLIDKTWLYPWLRKPISKLVAIIERISIRFFVAVVAVTPAIAKRFPEESTVLVQNFPILSEFPSAQRLASTGRHWITYVGGISASRGIIEMIQATNLVDPKLNVELKLAGSIHPADLKEQMAATLGWDRSEYLGWQSRDEVAKLLVRSSIGLVVLHPTQNHVESQPIKLFEYMSAGLPVIASDFPLWREIVQGVGCGLLVDPTDPRAISEAITWMLKHPEQAREMGKKGRKAAEETYNWEPEAIKLRSLYENICS